MGECGCYCIFELLEGRNSHQTRNIMFSGLSRKEGFLLVHQFS